MKETDSNRKNYYLIIVGFSLVALYWIVDSFLDSLLSRHTINEALFYPNLDILFMRFFVAFLFIAFSAYARYIITKRKFVEMELQRTIKLVGEEKSKTEAIIAALGDGIIIQDTGYKIIYQNQVQNDLYGDRTGELCYRTYEGRDKICVDCPVERTFRDGNIHRSERKVVTDKGDYYYELTSSPLRDSNGKIIAGIKVVRDITGSRRMEQTLRKSEEKYRRLVETLMEGIWVLDKDAITTFVNPRMAQMLGYTVDEMLGKHLFSFIDEQGRMNATRYLDRRKQNVKEQHDYEFIRKDGTKIYTSLETSPITDEKGNYSGAIAAIADITERKRDENEKNRLLKAIDSSTDGITICDEKDRYIYVNAAYARIFGYFQEDFIGETWRKITPSDIIPVVEKGLEETLHKKDIGIFFGEVFGLNKVGMIIPTEVRGRGIWDEKGNYQGHICVVRDITERKHADDQIKASLKEKEVLLREIHHRVKNNMQIISSLLKLQAGYIEDKKYLDMFKESQNRILTMSLVHEKLYRSKDFTKINFKEYIHDLANGVFQSYSGRSSNILLNLNIENVDLGIDSAIPCGLIINELVTNSLKYAFPGEKKGEIKIVLGKIDGNKYELTVSDNGIGIPEDLDFRKTETLGLHLVLMLAEDQLSGKIKLDRSNGTEFSIRFGDGI